MHDSRRSSPNNVSRSETPNSVGGSVVYNIHGGHNNLGGHGCHNNLGGNNPSYYFAPINFGGSIGSNSRSNSPHFSDVPLRDPNE